MRRFLVGWILIAPFGLIGGQTSDHVPAEECPMKKAAAPSPYTGLEHREIKALSDDDRRQLLAGRGMGFALAAELNRPSAGTPADARHHERRTSREL